MEAEDFDRSQRKYLKYYMDLNDDAKPAWFYELEAKIKLTKSKDEKIFK